MDSLEFLHSDDTFAALNKPGGVLTQAPPGIDSIEFRARRWRASQLGTPHPYVGLPHRLDRPASGVLVIGWTRNATKRVAEQFERRSVEKIYWCLVSGTVSEEVGQWTDWMRKIPDQAKSELVPADHPDAQLAVLQYRVLGRTQDQTWLGIVLETGRTHQIRVQCAARGHPILGDDLYGARHPFGPQTSDLRQRWIALHARQLTLQSPARPGSPLVITAPLSHHWEHWQREFAALPRNDR